MRFAVLPGVILVVVSALWVYIDARRLKVLSSGESSVGYGLGTLFLWVVFFPVYLVKRRRWIEGRPVVLAGAGQKDPVTGRPGPGWYPDPARADSIKYWDGSAWGASAPRPTVKPRSRSAAILIAIGITVVLFALSAVASVVITIETETVNTAEVAQILADHFNTVQNDVSEVECPAHVPRRAGHLYYCTIAVAGAYKQIEVDEHSGGTFTYLLTTSLVPEPAGPEVSSGSTTGTAALEPTTTEAASMVPLDTAVAVALSRDPTAAGSPPVAVSCDATVLPLTAGETFVCGADSIPPTQGFPVAVKVDDPTTVPVVEEAWDSSNVSCEHPRWALQAFATAGLQCIDRNAAGVTVNGACTGCPF